MKAVSRYSSGQVDNTDLGIGRHKCIQSIYLPYKYI